MGRKCVVPFCRGGYNPTKKEREEGEIDPERKVTVFGFPEDEELKKTWIAKIPRKFQTVGSNSGVCQKHFSSSDVLYARDDATASR